MFQRTSVHYGKSPEAVTPYQRAAQVWDDRIGSSRVQARNWRLAFFASLALSTTMSIGLLWQMARGTVTPWIVEVDKLGQAQAVAPATRDYRPTDPQIAFHLARFVEQVRSLPTDPIILRQNWLRAYDFTTDRGAAALSEYVRRDDPFTKVGRIQVAVDISSVIRASDDSFRIAWVERRYEQGILSDTSRWSAILTVSLQPPQSEDILTRNPLGIFVDALNWSKEFGQ